MGDGIFALAYISGEQEEWQGEHWIEDCLLDDTLENVGCEAWCRIGVSPVLVMADWGTSYLHEEAILFVRLEMALLFLGGETGKREGASEPKAAPLGK